MVNHRTYKGLDFFVAHDQHILEILLRGEHNISGFRNADLRHQLSLNAGQVSRLLKRLRIHGRVKRIGRTYKYDLTALGRRALIAGQKNRHVLLSPLLTANC
jgi:DNA-binding IclR family transcriptional regulator